MSLISYFQQNIWAHLPAKPKPRDILWAAILYPGTLFLIAGIRYYRAASNEPLPPTSSIVLTLVGIALAVSLAIPGLREKVYLTILRVTATLGWFIGRLGLTLVFYLVVTPMGLLLRLMGKDPLDQGFKRGSPPQWKPHEKRDEPRRYYRLF